MSSSSCYDDSPTEHSDEESSAEIKENNSDDDNTVVITHTKVIARRFEFWHEKFLNYQEILDYLLKIGELYQHKCTIERLGYSKEQRPICLVRICSNKLRRPPMCVFIEAGSNGREKMTVSSALYLIDFLVKNVKLVGEYLIIPCLNPDGYEKCLNRKKIPKKDQIDIDLTRCFPLMSTDTPSFMTKLLGIPSDVPSNCLLLSRVVEKYGTNVKLFISLQASESTITYPLDHYFKDVYDFALACRKSMEWDSLDIKPIVPSALTQDKGTAVEHVIRKYHQNLKFAYLLNVHNKNFVPEEKFILTKGEQTLTGILTLTKRVYRYYYRQSSRYRVATVVKLLDSTE